MRIYLAGLIQTGFVWRGNSRSENVLLSEEVRLAYPYDLESFHYIRETRDAPAYFRHHKKTIFLDSGAYSMFTKGVVIELSVYADYIKRNRDIIHLASNIDVIGRGQEQASWDNQKKLERLGVDVQPVHHARDDDKWMERYIAEGYTSISLGGMVPESTQYLRVWLDRIFGKFVVRRDGTPKIKIHGFGLTTLELMRRYPWYSVDSTSWVLSGRFGSVYFDLPSATGVRDIKICFSDQSPKSKDWDQHYTTLDPIAKAMVDERLGVLGYDAGLLGTHYGWRDHFNIQFFKRVMERPDPVFKPRDQIPGLF